VSRLAVLAVAVLAAAVVPISGAAAAQAASCQPDVSIAQRGDRVPAGEDLYSADAVGQTRNVLITNEQVRLVVRVQNDGARPCSFTITGTHGTDGFDIQYTEPGTDVTGDVIDGTYKVDLEPGKTHTLKVRVAAEVDVSLGAKQDALVRAVSTTDPNLVDAGRATVTKVTEPLGP
jgi:hypothetical protein